MNKYLLNVVFVLLSLLLPAQTAGSEIPTVKIRVAQYEKQLEIVMPKGGQWESGSRHDTLRPGKTYRIVGKLLTPAVRKYHLMVGSAPYNRPRILTEVEARYQQFRTHRFLAGYEPAPGYPDNRIVFVGIGIFEDELTAKKQLDELAAKGISSWIFYENIKPAQGTLTIYRGKKKLFESNDSIELLPTVSTTLKNAEYAKGFSWHGFANRSYAGHLSIRWGFENVIDCIEKTDLESLLVGIVPSEISANAPDAAKQAQAVAARGEMLSKRGTRHFNEGFDFCSEQHCQVYKGLQSVDKAISHSIKNTRGLIMLSREGGILDAVYSANCGGHTSANHKIWVSNPNPHLKGVCDLKVPTRLDLTKHEQVRDFIVNPPEAWCSLAGVEGADKFRWKKNLNQTDWKKVEAAAEVGRIREIGNFEREVSGRIISLKITGSLGEKTVLRELPIRRLFGMLRSSNFIVDWKRDEEGYIVGADFMGAGWGHGVGMCQTGAQSMAKAGHHFDKILLHYFPGAILKRLY